MHDHDLRRSLREAGPYRLPPLDSYVVTQRVMVRPLPTWRWTRDGNLYVVMRRLVGGKEIQYRLCLPPWDQGNRNLMALALRQARKRLAYAVHLAIEERFPHD